MISDVGLAYQTVKIELEYMGVPQQLAIYLPSVIITLWVSFALPSLMGHTTELHQLLERRSS